MRKLKNLSRLVKFNLNLKREIAKDFIFFFLFISQSISYFIIRFFYHWTRQIYLVSGQMYNFYHNNHLIYMH
jgi:hypothetical protein